MTGEFHNFSQDDILRYLYPIIFLWSSNSNTGLNWGAPIVCFCGIPGNIQEANFMLAPLP